MAKTSSLYFVADIHGSEVCWRKFLNAAKFYGVDTIIVGGDVTGKALVPVIERRDGRVEARIAGRVQTARSEAEVAELEARIRFNGFYPYRCDEATYEKLDADPAHRDEVFTAVMAETLRSWLRLADERLRGTGIRALIMPGNDDGWYVDDVLSESAQVVNSDGRVIDLGEYQVLGFGPSNRTPWHTHRELDEPEIAARLETLQRQVDPAKPLVVATHVPPWGTGIDVAPKLREDLSVVIQGGEPVMVPVGSTAVREFVERTQPILSLHGHIHESRGATRLGRTLAINPGSAYSTGALYGAIVTIRQGKVLSHQLVAG
ncbi:MAG: metallophosphoesterase family protein [Chloroflexota bacterium]